jgi:hypothetical protein
MSRVSAALRKLHSAQLEPKTSGIAERRSHGIGGLTSATLRQLTTSQRPAMM